MSNAIKANFYIDGNFAYHYYKHLHSFGRTINWNALKTYILDKIEKKESGEAVFDQCHYFMEISSQQDELEHKLFKTSLADSSFSQINLSLKSTENHTEFKEDAIDTTLVLTAQEEAYSMGYEYAVLFAGDSDLAPLPYFLKKKGIKTILVYCDIETENGNLLTQTSLKLQHECEDHVYLNDLLNEEQRQIANLQRRALLVNFDFPDFLKRLIFPQIKNSGKLPKTDEVSKASTNLEQKNSSSFTPISANGDNATPPLESEEEEDWFGNVTSKPEVLNVVQTNKMTIEPKVSARRKGVISNTINRNSNKSVFIHTSDFFGDFYAQLPEDWKGEVGDIVEFNVTKDYNPEGQTNLEKNGLADNVILVEKKSSLVGANLQSTPDCPNSSSIQVEPLQRISPLQDSIEESFFSRIPTIYEIRCAIDQLQTQKDADGYVYVNEVGFRLKKIMGCPIAGKLKDIIVQHPDLFETQDQPAYRIRKRRKKTPMQTQIFRPDPAILARFPKVTQHKATTEKRNSLLENQIKPTDWAEANGVKVDLVMKLLREAGVTVRTHMSKVDAKDYEKIKDAVALEKNKPKHDVNLGVKKSSFDQIKPTDWAEANGVKVDLVMKLLREAGVTVRTHMSKVDAKDYEKIKETIAREKEKKAARKVNHGMTHEKFDFTNQSKQSIYSMSYNSSEEIFKKVSDVIVAKLKVKTADVKQESELNNDLGADALDCVEIVIAIEDEFEVEISDSDAEKFVKVADIVNFLVERKNASTLEKEEQVIKNANFETKQGFFSGLFKSFIKNSTQKNPIVWLDETNDECVSCGVCEATCDVVFSVLEKMHVNENVNYFAYKDEIVDAAAGCPAGVIKYNFSLKS